MRYVQLISAAAMVFASGLFAQNPGAGRGGAMRRSGPPIDEAARDRGKAAFVAACGFCHGANAKGGEGGPDLIRSVLVIDDENGKEIGAFLKAGRPDKGMPAFPNLPENTVRDIATFLHAEITFAGNRSSYQILNILVGDARAGEAYFNGAGGCTRCHSVTGDLKGVGAKYDPVALQGKIVMPGPGRGFFGGRGRGGMPAPPPTGPQMTATITWPDGRKETGALIRVTDFDVIIRDSSGVSHTYPRVDESPKVEVHNPYQAHIDLLSKYSDKNIHDLTAYLATLK